MNKNYNSIKQKIALLPKKQMGQKEIDFIARYMGSNRKFLGIKTAELIKIAKETLKENLSTKEIIGLLDNLFFGDNFEEYIIGGKIFTFLKPEIRAQIPLNNLERWLSEANGWLEVDVICQSTFTSKEVLEGWNEWQKMIKEFSESKIISLRRASIVLQIKPNKEINDQKMRSLAFLTIEKLKLEKEVLITKAISWLLRGLTEQDKEEVRRYIKENEFTLPRIAVRETLKKIETGKKNFTKN